MTAFSGGEIRLNSGQLARMSEGGTVEVIEPSEPVEIHYFFRMTVTHKDDLGKPKPLAVKPTQASCVDYDILISFLKQLENCDYVMTSMERIAGKL